MGLLTVFILAFWYLNTKVAVEAFDTPESISLKIPEESGETKKNSVVLEISENIKYHLNDEEIEFLEIERRLLDLRKTTENNELTVVLKAEKTVPVEKIVEIMEIVNKNELKVILTVHPN